MYIHRCQLSPNFWDGPQTGSFVPKARVLTEHIVVSWFTGEAELAMHHSVHYLYCTDNVLSDAYSTDVLATSKAVKRPN